MMMRPVSMSWSKKKVVTPVSVSPLMTAQLMGAAPRYWGNKAACTLNVPNSGIAHTTSGNILKATTTCRLALYERSCSTNSGSFIFSGWSTGKLCSSAYCFTCEGCSTLPCRPTGLSGCVTTATTLYSFSTSARSVSTANSGVPINTILRSLFFMFSHLLFSNCKGSVNQAKYQRKTRVYLLVPKKMFNFAD